MYEDPLIIFKKKEWISRPRAEKRFTFCLIFISHFNDTFDLKCVIPELVTKNTPEVPARTEVLVEK